MNCAPRTRRGCRPIWRRPERIHRQRGSIDGDGCGDDRAAHPGEPPGCAGLDRGSARRRRPLCGACRLALLQGEDASTAAPDGLSSAARANGQRAPCPRPPDQRPRGLAADSARADGYSKGFVDMANNIVFDRIKQDVTSNPVVLFMKGTPVFPQCGFSAAVVQILSHIGVKFKGIDVLTDPEIRQGIKEYSSWPTIPQLYVKGEFVGGCDIVREMFESGELQELLQTNGIATRAA